MKKILFVFTFCLLLINVSCTTTNSSIKKGNIDLLVDTKQMTVEKNDDATWYELDIKNSNDLQYIIITIEITDNSYFAKQCKLIVNGNVIDKSKYEIKDNIITYEMDDPNWSDFI